MILFQKFLEQVLCENFAFSPACEVAIEILFRFRFDRNEDRNRAKGRTWSSGRYLKGRRGNIQGSAPLHNALNTVTSSQRWGAYFDKITNIHSIPSSSVYVVWGRGSRVHYLKGEGGLVILWRFCIPWT